MFKRLLFILIVSVALVFVSCDDDSSTESDTQATEYTVLDSVGGVARTQVTDYGEGTGTMTWTNDRAWVLDGFVFVNEGQVLTIQPGTVVKGRSGQGANASALIVARGGRIVAEGTATQPIVFTAEADGNQLSDLQDLGVRGLWGGLIVLGSARINTAVGEGQIEGIPEDEPRGAYGGTDDADDSGVLKYISVRYGGTEIGQANEINGVTFGAVGSGTEVDYVEVVYNKDDGFEWFGGTVNCKHLVGAFVGDDVFDYDEGFRGKGQFWFGIHAADAGDRAGEHDGGTDPEDGQPYAMPQIFNATYIGSGASSANGGNLTFKIRDNAGAKYYHSIFYDFTDKAVDIEDLTSGEDSRARLDAGDIDFRYNIWYAFGAGNTAADMCDNDYEEILFTDAARMNDIVDPVFTSISRTNNGGLNPKPTAAKATSDLGTVPSDGFYDNAQYKGAFDPNGTLWVSGWSFVSSMGYTAE